MKSASKQGQAYETPRLERVGTIAELTGGQGFAGSSDSFYCFRYGSSST
ncbi:MAG: lasso RiPP family leader peptide-containing protein [Acidimicrobiales bacterium]